MALSRSSAIPLPATKKDWLENLVGYIRRNVCVPLPRVKSLKACLQGYRVLFKNAGSLSTELTEARDAYQLGRIERLLDKTDLLILDELSYMSFNKYESELLFKVISDRSERSSTIVTTNLPFSRWTELFENNTLVSALVDRLTFRSHVLDMSGPSYRLLPAQASANQ